MRFVVLFVLLFPVATAHADDRRKATTAMFQVQMDTWRKADNDKFRATLTKDVVVARNGDWMRPDWNLEPPYNISALKVVASKIGWSNNFGWITADIHLTSRWYAEPEGAGNPHPEPEDEIYHWVELVIPDGDAGVKGRALAIYKAGHDSMKYVPFHDGEITPLATTPPDALAAMARATELPTLLANDPATSVVGTDDDETAFGPTAAKKLTASWSKLELSFAGKTKWMDGKFFEPIELVVGDATVVWGRVQLKKKSSLWLMDAFAIARKTQAGTYEYVAIAYGHNG